MAACVNKIYGFMQTDWSPLRNLIGDWLKLILRGVTHPQLLVSHYIHSAEDVTSAKVERRQGNIYLYHFDTNFFLKIDCYADKVILHGFKNFLSDNQPYSIFSHFLGLSFSIFFLSIIFSHKFT